MRDFKEYEDIFKKLSQREVAYCKQYLNLHPNYSLNDIYYTAGINNAFSKWRDHKDITKLTCFIEAINNHLRGSATLDNLVDYLEDFDELRDHVYAYADEHLKENSLNDKHHILKAIQSPDIDYLYDYDTEVREGFVECYQGGMMTLREEIKTRLKNIEHDERVNNKEQER